MHHLGSTRLFVRDSGTVYDKYFEYKVYGDMVREEVNWQQYYKFSGKPFDIERGVNLYYFGARYYDPALGRWLAPDPAANKNPSLSPYAYCAGNPIGFIDNNGKWREEIHNDIIEQAFGDLLNRQQIEAIESGSAYADEFQKPEDSYMHAMRGPGQSMEDAEQKMDEFMSIKTAEFLKSDNLDYMALGMALHPLMDQFSPSHQGFQEWKGVWRDPVGAFIHYMKEIIINPAQLSEVVAAVREYYLNTMNGKRAVEQIRSNPAVMNLNDITSNYCF